MKARYSDIEVSVSATDCRIDLGLVVENGGPEVWSDSDRFATSYQVLEFDSDEVLLDGPRTAFEQDVAPKQCARVRLAVDLPRRPGRYRVFVSPLQETVAWFYAAGSPFLLLDADVGDNGNLKLRRKAVVTSRRLRLERLWRFLARAVSYPVLTLIRNRSLLASMIQRDIAGRYRGSYGGIFWTVIHPLLMMLTYYFVFGVVLQTRFGDDGRPANFVVYFLAGMLPWLAISEAVGRSAGVVLEHANFVKKLIFPLEILPATLVFAGLVSQAFGVVIFLGVLTLFGYTVPLTVLYLPLLLVPQFFLTLGLCWFLATLGVFFRDLGQILGFLLTVWFFTTPICYPVSHLPQDYLWIFDKNPLFILVGAYRAIFLEAQAPAWTPLLWLTAGSVVLLILGHGWFYKLKKSFADIL